MKIKRVKIDEIGPYKNNPRINHKAIEAVKKSIEQFGYNNLITVDSNNVIVTGHTRHEALKQLGYKEIDVIVLDELDEQKIKEFRIMDNKIQELSEWDEEKLFYELRRYEDELDKNLKNVVIELKEKFEKEVEIDIYKINDEKIQEKEEELKNYFENVSKSYEDNLVYIKCKCCGEEIGIDKRQLK